jgi:hypothetical protein
MDLVAQHRKGQLILRNQAIALTDVIEPSGDFADDDAKKFSGTRTAHSPQLVSWLMFLTAAQSSVNFVWRERFWNEITEPITNLLMTRVIGVLKCFEKLCKSLGSLAVFRWTRALTRNANLLKRFVSKQNLFKNKLVLPAVPEIVLVQ